MREESRDWRDSFLDCTLHCTYSKGMVFSSVITLEILEDVVLVILQGGLWRGHSIL